MQYKFKPTDSAEDINKFLVTKSNLYKGDIQKVVRKLFSVQCLRDLLNNKGRSMCVVDIDAHERLMTSRFMCSIMGNYSNGNYIGGVIRLYKEEFSGDFSWCIVLNSFSADAIYNLYQLHKLCNVDGVCKACDGGVVTYSGADISSLVRCLDLLISLDNSYTANKLHATKQVASVGLV